MYNTFSSSPDFDHKGERVALLQGCYPKSQSRYKNDAPRVELMVMAQQNDGAFRWADWSGNERDKSFLVANLYLRADFEMHSSAEVTYSNHRIEFDCHLPVNHVAAQHMLATFRRTATVELPTRGLDPVDTAVWFISTLKKLNIKRWVCYQHDTQRGNLDSAGNFREVQTMGEFVRLLYLYPTFA